MKLQYPDVWSLNIKPSPIMKWICWKYNGLDKGIAFYSKMGHGLKTKRAPYWKSESMFFPVSFWQLTQANNVSQKAVASISGDRIHVVKDPSLPVHNFMFYLVLKFSTGLILCSTRKNLSNIFLSTLCLSSQHHQNKLQSCHCILESFSENMVIYSENCIKIDI